MIFYLLSKCFIFSLLYRIYDLFSFSSPCPALLFYIVCSSFFISCIRPILTAPVLSYFLISLLSPYPALLFYSSFALLRFAFLYTLRHTLNAPLFAPRCSFISLHTLLLSSPCPIHCLPRFNSLTIGCTNTCQCPSSRSQRPSLLPYIVSNCLYYIVSYIVYMILFIFVYTYPNILTPKLSFYFSTLPPAQCTTRLYLHCSFIFPLLAPLHCLSRLNSLTIGYTNTCQCPSPRSQRSSLCALIRFKSPLLRCFIHYIYDFLHALNAPISVALHRFKSPLLRCFIHYIYDLFHGE